ncbi:MAG: hypothetical protein ABSC93_32195 [Bryobacteraceae bacterium]
MRTLVIPALAAALLISCGAEPKPSAPEPDKPAAAARPADESRRLPLADRVDAQVVDNHLLDKPFMPGGTLAHYKRGKIEYSMFVARMPNAQDAAFLLLDWHKALASAKIIPAFGGYFGQDGARPVFVFAKGAWVAGVAGLPEKDADLAARGLAAHLD